MLEKKYAPTEFQRLKCIKPYLAPTEYGLLPMPCGKCLYCRKQKATEWKNRLIDEFKVWENVSFLTLTYKEVSPFEEPHIFEKSRNLDYRDIQIFMKRLRIYLKRKHSIEKIKFFCAGEYGEKNTRRAHWHLILFGIPNTKTIQEAIKKMWEYEGSTKNLDMQTCYDEKGVSSYVSQYVVKKIDIEAENEAKKENRKPPFQHCSKGIGLTYALQNYVIPAYKCFKEFGNFSNIIFEGKKLYFCRYIRNKILNILETFEKNITYKIKDYGMNKIKEYAQETKDIFVKFWNCEIFENIIYNKYDMPKKIRHKELTQEEIIQYLNNRLKIRLAWQFRHELSYKKALKLHEIYKLDKKIKNVI